MIYLIDKIALSNRLKIYGAIVASNEIQCNSEMRPSVLSHFCSCMYFMRKGEWNGQ